MHSSGASITNLKEKPRPVTWLRVTKVQFDAEFRPATPDEIIEMNDGFHFDFTYNSTAPGMKTITLAAQEPDHFQVRSG